MKIDNINNQNMAFKAIFREPKAIYTTEQNAVIENIKSELNRIDPSSKKNETYLSALENRYTDVFLKSNNDGDSIDMFLSKFSVFTSKPDSLEQKVGTFNEKKPFTAESFRETFEDFKKEYEAVSSKYVTVLGYLFLIAFATVAIATGYTKNKKPIKNPEPLENVITTISDRVSNVIKDIEFTLKNKKK